MSYNLNDNVKDEFEFILGGFKYFMKYPTVEQTEAIQVEIKKDAEDSEAILAQVYGLVTSEDKDAPDIAKTMQKQNIKVLKNFTNMIKVEFGGEEA